MKTARFFIAICFIAVLLAICVCPVMADIPTNIVDQYWVWFKLPPGSQSNDPGYWVNYINKIDVAAPVWEERGSILQINNVERPGYVKNIWLEVKYILPQTEITPVTVVDPQGVSYNPTKSWISSNGQFVTWQWQLPWQPASEELRFGTTDFYTLNGMELVEIGTQCVPVPEPSGLVALGAGLMGLAGFALRKR